jgi:hypothetical protein
VVLRNVGVGQTIDLGDPYTGTFPAPPALQVNLGPSQSDRPPTLANNYSVTGDFAFAFTDGLTQDANGFVTTQLYPPYPPIPDGADIVAAYLYWGSLEDPATTPQPYGFFATQPDGGNSSPVSW